MVSNVFPNLDMALTFGGPAYEQIVLGGGALQASWAGDELGDHLFRYQEGGLHHMIQIGAGWVQEAGVNSLVNSLNHVAANFARQPVHEIPNPSIYLTPARSRDPNHPASDTTLSQITGLVGMCDGTFLDRELANFFEVESPGFLNAQTINQTPVTHAHATGSLQSVRTAIARNDGQLVGNWKCNRCGEDHGVRHDYNAQCYSCGEGARFCLLNDFDLQIRGFCPHCNNSGKYNQQHTCPNHPTDTKAPYTLAVPNDDFVYEASGRRAAVLVRGQNLLTGSYDRSYSHLDGVSGTRL